MTRQLMEAIIEALSAAVRANNVGAFKALALLIIQLMTEPETKTENQNTEEIEDGND